MKFIHKLIFLFIWGLMTLTVKAGEVNLSGFASFVGGKVTSGTGVDEYGVPPTFLADYPIVGAYEEDLSFKPDTLFGVQISADLSDGLSATAQVVARGANEFDAEFEWAYLSYEFNDHWTLQAGKKRLPLYYYSDFFDVGYAYTWIRPPADNYTWQIFNYNGANLRFSDSWGDWDISANVYTGREDDVDNKLLGEFFFLATTREIWKDIFGGVFQATWDWLDIRATFMSYTNERYIDGERVLWDGRDERDGDFKGLSVNADWNNIVVLTEFNKLTLDGGDFDTYMVSLAYRIGSLTPYVSYSDFDSGPIEETENHNTTSFGIRWDFHPSAAFKFQFDEVKDEALPSSGLRVAGDSKAISFGVDLVF